GANISSIDSTAFSSSDTLDVDYSNLEVLYNCGYVIHKTHSVNIYYRGKELTHIDVPENITTIRAEQFKNVKNLESINIPNSVKSISDNAFTGCQSLMSVAFSDSITSIGTQAFQGCTSLISISLPDTLMTIGNQAFKGCTSLTTANLSDSLKTIGNEAFYDCEALANITCPALVPPTVGTDGFEGVNNYTCILTIPGESLMDYAKIAEWVAFFQKRKRIDVEVDTPVVDEGESEGESESGSEGDTGKGDFCGGHIWYDRDWHKHHGGHHAPRRYAAAEEPVAVNGIDATIGDGLSLFIATDSVVSFLIEPEEGYAIGSVRYGGVDVTNQLNNGVFTTSAVSANTKLEVTFVEGDAPVVTVMLGDANNDGTVNVGDAVVIVNYILGDESAVASLVNADANEDGVINVADVVSTVNIILSQGVQAAPMRYEGGKGCLAMNDLVIAHGETAGIEVALDNEAPYAAFQVDVTLPEGLTVNDITLSNRLNATHSMMWRMQDDNTLRVVVFAVDNSAVADNSGALFTIEVTADAAFEGGNIVADNAIFTVRDLTTHHLDTAVAGAKNTAGIDGTYTTDRIYTMGRTIVIESTCDQVAYITTTGGAMRAEEVKAGRNEITLSQQGLYIVVVGSETQKVIIR
ncbi:MAG: leucine-rich repeat protein, partial [Bacteroidaceae bacterium]|nr:leucine-rich repeat protein [Bacteroidaceae bacterium]